MPRKTRKQKEMAQKRREAGEFESRSQILVKREFSFSENEFKIFQQKKSGEKKFDKSFPDTAQEFAGRDLIKTFLLALTIFGLETVIYFAWFKQARF